MLVTIFDTADGGVTVFTPTAYGLTLETLEEITARSTPVPGAPFDVIDLATLPDKTFRNAWVRTGGAVMEDLPRAVQLTHVRRRAKRELDFAPLDDIVSKNIPGTDPVQAENDRAAIRVADAGLQAEIDNALDTTELRAIIARDQL